MPAPRTFKAAQEAPKRAPGRAIRPYETMAEVCNPNRAPETSREVTRHAPEAPESARESGP
eukprot:3527126-Pyramimonas_sp.AAC.1